MEDIGIVEVLAQIGTAGATIALVFLLYKAIRQMDETVKLSRIQTEHRFRGWVGPNNGIKKIENSINTKQQFDVGIKNYGEIPAQNVIAKSKVFTKMPSKEMINSNDLVEFDMGPMLPNMEKHYWFFIEEDLWRKAENGTEKIFTIVYFEYDAPSGKSGYGMISEYDPKSKNFIHRDMWIDNEKN